MRNFRFPLATFAVLTPLLLFACGKRGDLFLPPKPAPAQTTPAPAATPPAAAQERLPENTR